MASEKTEIEKLGEEIKSHTDKGIQAVKETVTKEVSEVKTEVTTLKTDIEAQKKEAEETKNKLTEEVQKLAEKVSAMAESGNVGGAQKELKDFFETKQKEFLAAAEKKGSASMVVTKVITGLAGSMPGMVPAERIDPSFIKMRDRTILMIVPQRPVTSDTIEWFAEATKTGGAEAILENAEKPDTDNTGAVQSVPTNTIAATKKVTKKQLRNVGWLQDFIQNELSALVLEILEANVLTGNGTAPQLYSINQWATAFSAGSIVVANATIIDVVSAALKQISDANQPYPTHILVGGTIMVALRSLWNAASTGNTRALAFDGGKFYIYGIEVVQNNLITDDKFYIVNTGLMSLYVAENINVEMFNQNENDAKFNRFMFRAEVEAAFVIKDNDRSAFIKGDLSDAITDLAS